MTQEGVELSYKQHQITVKPDSTGAKNKWVFFVRDEKKAENGLCVSHWNIDSKNKAIEMAKECVDEWIELHPVYDFEEAKITVLRDGDGWKAFIDEEAQKIYGFGLNPIVAMGALLKNMNANNA